MSLLRTRDRTRAADVVPPTPATGAVVLEATDVRVELGGVPVLRGLTLQVRAGEVLAVVGPNGAGKSTALAALTGDVPAVGGQVRLHDRPLADWSEPQQARRRAVLLQQVTLSFPFTVGEVVAMGRAPWAGTPAEDDDEVAVAEAMEATDVRDFADRRFSELSGGERARVALARVLAQRTGALLLDEPTAALDIRHQEAVLRVARQRAAAGDAVLAVLHDLNLAAAHADRVAVLADGVVRAVGEPAQVLTEAVLSEVFAHPVEVVAHPRDGSPVVLPRRG